MAAVARARVKRLGDVKLSVVKAAVASGAGRVEVAYLVAHIQLVRLGNQLQLIAAAAVAEQR